MDKASPSPSGHPPVPCGSSQGLGCLPLLPVINRVLHTALWPITVQMVPSLLAALSRNRVVSQPCACWKVQRMTTRRYTLFRPPILSYM